MTRKQNNIKKETLLKVIQRLSEQELRQFAASVVNDAKGKKLFIEAFEHYIPQTRRAEYYLEQVQNAYIDAALENDYIYHADQMNITIAVDDALEVAQAFCEEGSVKSALTLCFGILELHCEYKDCADDSYGTMSSIMLSTLDTLDTLVDPAKNSKDEALREYFIDNCWDCIEDDLFENDDSQEKMYDILCRLANCDEEYQAILDGLHEDKSLNRIDGNNEHLLRIQKNILTLWHGEEAGANFMAQHLEYPDFRGQTIQRAIEEEDFQHAYLLCQEGLAQTKRGDGNIRCRWYELMKIAAQKEGNRTILIEAASYLLLHQWNQSKSHYNLLKSIVTTEEWPNFIEELAKRAQQDNRQRYADICAWEGWTDRLLTIVQQLDDFKSIKEYEPYLLPKFRKDLTERYVQVAREMMDKNERNRNTYQWMREVLEQAVNIGGNEEVEQAITTMKTEFKRYRRLMEELDKVAR